MSTEVKKEEEYSSSDSEEEIVTSTPRKPAGLPSITIPKNFIRIGAENLAELIRKREDFQVIDVRDQDFVGGNVVGAVNISHSTFESRSEELVQRYGGKKYVVFNCMHGQLRSPASALGFVQKLKQHSLSADNVFVLSGGFQEFLVKFGKEAGMIENFDQKYWNDQLLHANNAFILSHRPQA
eukprot:TRINITY_DN1148_c1_g1_i1.p1 TRINITY_DN1148_c1_g1~~TRINITY_DN1148_c1_g1_i1.p1  ORF type:complete len:182 (-),score=82.20 TRINITY_DN1148_c1_g1_i1:114-659(-)